MEHYKGLDSPDGMHGRPPVQQPVMLSAARRHGREMGQALTVCEACILQSALGRERRIPRDLLLRIAWQPGKHGPLEQVLALLCCSGITPGVVCP